MWALGAVRVLSALFRCFQDMEDVKQLLAEYARRYETPDFLPADPSCFMHKVDGDLNRETLAFIASCLSYGSRKQFSRKSSMCSIVLMAKCTTGWCQATFRQTYPTMTPDAITACIHSTR